uniref:Uncharacterized protein n=1 Tax=Octopus bimaculoides TaxID=37653 RepID=A0A0L8GU76_OCTBM
MLFFPFWSLIFNLSETLFLTTSILICVQPSMKFETTNNMCLGPLRWLVSFSH